MFSRFLLTVGVILSPLFASPLRADCLLRALPADGAWVTFYCTENWSDGTKRTMHVTLKSVGKKKVNGEACRWIELKYQTGTTSKKGAALKFLIPEKQLKPAGNPLKNACEAWRGSSSVNPPRKVNNLPEVYPRLHLVISPAIKNLKKTGKARKVAWQKGELQTALHTGSAKYEYPVEKLVTKYELSLSKKVPFGVAAARLYVKSNGGYTGVIEYSLHAMGTNGKSELPSVK